MTSVIRFDDVPKLGGEKPERNRLQDEFDYEKTRLDRLRQQCKKTRDAETEKALYRIDAEQMLHQVESALAARTTNSDVADKCDARLRDLKRALDEVEDILEWPVMVATTGKEIERVRSIINEPSFGATAQERAIIHTLESRIRNAIDTRDSDLLRRKAEEMDLLGIVILRRQPALWIYQLEQLEKVAYKATDRAKSADYIAQGRCAIDQNDLDGLKAVVRQLIALLPPDESKDFGGGMQTRNGRP